jgi:hypothetical protein
MTVRSNTPGQEVTASGTIVLRLSEPVVQRVIEAVHDSVHFEDLRDLVEALNLSDLLVLWDAHPDLRTGGVASRALPDRVLARLGPVARRSSTTDTTSPAE